MATYTYNNGNFTSNTTIASNGVVYTQNVTNLGGGCGNGDTYCKDGYSLYFPCLKEITRGQKVCYNFYIADNATKDVMDLRDVDAITIELSGRYGCVYGDFSYPDDIFSLQEEKYDDIIFLEDFEADDVCTLSVDAVSLPDFGHYEGYSVEGSTGLFYKGDRITLKAYDTKDKIFVGWGDANIILDDDYDGELCSLTLDDILIVPSRCSIFTLSENGYQIEFDIDTDRSIFAIYRDRETFKVDVNWNRSRGLRYDIWYDGNLFELTDYGTLHTDSADDSTVDSYVEVLEGHEVFITAVPYIYDSIDSDSDFYCDGDFSRWWDGSTERSRLITVSGDMNIYAVLDSAKEWDGTTDAYNNIKVWESHKLVEAGLERQEFNTDENPDILDNDLYVESGIVIRGEGNGILKVDENSLISIGGISDEYGIKVVVNALSAGSEPCMMTVSCGDESLEAEVMDSNDYSFFYRVGGVVSISVDGEVDIDSITVYREEIVNKGLCQLCLDGEDTLNFQVGPVYASGAVMVNGVAYGLPTTTIGNVTSLKKININQ